MLGTPHSSGMPCTLPQALRCNCHTMQHPHACMLTRGMNYRAANHSIKQPHTVDENCTLSSCGSSAPELGGPLFIPQLSFEAHKWLMHFLITACLFNLGQGGWGGGAQGNGQRVQHLQARIQHACHKCEGSCLRMRTTLNKHEQHICVDTYDRHTHFGSRWHP